MQGRIEFKHDIVNDIIIVNPKWKIETKEDCEVWHKQWIDFLSKFKRNMDCIMILNDFAVDPKIASEWGEYRTKLFNDYTRFSYRINPKLTTGIFNKTIGIRYNASLKEAASLDSAYEAIKQDRKKVGSA